MADRIAKEAATNVENRNSAVNYNIAKSIIKTKIIDDPPKHHLVKQTYSNLSHKRDKSDLKNRKDCATIAQLRSGHCLLLAAYRNRIDDSKSEVCPRCDEAPQTVEHWILDCPGTISERQRIFGRTDVGLEVLTKNPDKTLALARSTLAMPRSS